MRLWLFRSNSFIKMNESFSESIRSFDEPNDSEKDSTRWTLEQESFSTAMSYLEIQPDNSLETTPLAI